MNGIGAGGAREVGCAPGPSNFFPAAGGGAHVVRLTSDFFRCAGRNHERFGSLFMPQAAALCRFGVFFLKRVQFIYLNYGSNLHFHSEFKNRIFLFLRLAITDKRLSWFFLVILLLFSFIFILVKSLGNYSKLNKL